MMNLAVLSADQRFLSHLETRKQILDLCYRLLTLSSSLQTTGEFEIMYRVYVLWVVFS